MSKIAIKEIEIETNVGRRTMQRLNERFLKGPIPLRHIAKAAKLPGQSLAVYLAVHHRCALTRRDQVTLPKHLLSQLGVSRDAKARALKELCKAGLVALDRQKGRSSRVTLLVASVAPEAETTEKMPIKNRQWAVTETGITCLTQQYEITKGQLAELRDAERGIAMWPLQMAEKSWVDIDEFGAAYEGALVFHKPFGADRINVSASLEQARQIVATRSRRTT